MKMKFIILVFILLLSIVKLQAQIEKPVTIDGEDYTGH